MSLPAIVVRPIEQVQLNDANPRFIKDNRFEQLVQSLIEFPDMLHVRPIVIDENGVALGGNMRLHAAMRLNYTEVPTIQVLGWSEEKKREFIIKDNASFGEWDFDVLANEWSELPIGVWGIDLPKDWLADEEPSTGGSGSGDSPDGEEEASGFAQQPTLIITFPSPEALQQGEVEVQELLDRKYPGAYLKTHVGERNG